MHIFYDLPNNRKTKTNQKNIHGHLWIDNGNLKMHIRSWKTVVPVLQVANTVYIDPLATFDHLHSLVSAALGERSSPETESPPDLDPIDGQRRAEHSSDHYMVISIHGKTTLLHRRLMLSLYETLESKQNPRVLET